MDVSRAIALWAPAGTPWRVSVIAVIAWLIPITAHAQADLFVIPFIGAKFAGHTNIPDPESPQQPAGATKTTFGVSAAILGDGVLGIDGDFNHTPHFFERGIGGLISQSNVTTLTGNVIFAVPRRITQDSLRPYLVAGVGLMHAHIQTQANVINTNSNLVGLDVGGGAIGFISPRAGARFELRHFKNLSKDDATATFGSTRLSFWRLTAGVVLRY
jgi:hypothetical protein